jgi:protein-disulfide isomerase
VNGTPSVFTNGQRVASVSEPEQIRALIRETVAKSAKPQVTKSE